MLESWIVDPPLPWLALASLALALLLLVVVVVLLGRSARARAAAAARPAAPTPFEPAAGEPAPAPRAASPVFASDGLSTSFARAAGFLRRRVSLRDPRYGLPWYLLLGEAGSGKTSALAASGLRLPLGAPSEVPDLGHPDCAWWLFERAVVLDPSGRFVHHPASGGDDERGWRRLLGLLGRWRPKRPLDGVILTVPAGDLVGPRRLAAEELLAKADRLSRKLWDLQHRLGMNLPVYVLVTKCDLVEGFAGLWRQVPAARRGEILGWTSPYAAGTAFSSAWIAEAFKGLEAGLVGLQLEIAADGDGPAVGPDELDGLARFPDAFRALEEPLRRGLDRLFRAGGYHESFFLRGIYFCGSEHAPQAGAGALPPKPILVRDLLEQVVFREPGLAAPAARALLARNRAVRAVQIGLAVSVVVAAVGLARAHVHLSEEAEALSPLFRQVAEAIAERREVELTLGRARHEVGGETGFFREEDALRLLEVMGRIEARTLTSAFMPTSLASDLDRRVGAFLTQGFELVVLRAMYHQLDQRARRLLQRPAAEGGETAPEVATAVGEAPEFLALQRLVAELGALERHAQLYNRLGEGGRVGDVGELALGLFGVRLPSTFFERGELYRRALAGARYERFDLDGLRGRATSQARGLTWKLYDRLFESGSLGTVLAELTLELRELALLGGRDLDHQAGRLARLEQSLRAVGALLAKPEVAWIARERLDLGDGFRGLLTDLAASRLFTAELAEEIAAVGEAEFERFRSRLLAYRAPGFGVLLAEEDGRPQPRLSPPLAAFAAALAGLFARDFMAVEAVARLPERYQPARPARWDPAELERALALFADYDGYAVSRLDQFPAGHQDLVRRLAVERLAANMMAAVARAWLPGRQEEPMRLAGGEERLRALIAGFRDAAPVLERVLTVLRQLGRIQEHAALETLLTQQAVDLLTRVDQLLQAESPYLPMSRLDFWDGATPVALHAYDASDRAELKLHLDLERERLQYVFQDLAEPPVAFLARRDLARDPAARALALRWQRLFEELGKYHLRRPDSTILALERFVQFEMADITLDNCFERLPAESFAGGGAADFFSQRRLALAESMLGRCLELGGDRLAARYNAFAARFDAALGGRFPFAAAELGARGAPLDPGALRAFFEQESAALDSLAEQMRDLPGGDTSWDAGLVFLERLQAARDFLFPGGPTPGRADVAYVVAVDFRVGRERERGANQIIDWALLLGDETLRAGDEPRLALWRYGEPAGVRLRWAMNAPVRPVAPPPGGRLALVDDDTAMIGYRDSWSLLRLLAAHGGAGAVGAEGHLLGFTIPTLAVGAAADRRALETARAFVRIRLFAPGPDGEHGQPLAAPAFPGAAPRIAGGEGWAGAPPPAAPGAVAPPRRTWEAGRGSNGGEHGASGRRRDDLGRWLR